MTARRSGQQSNRCGSRVLLTGCLLLLSGGNVVGWTQGRSAGDSGGKAVADTRGEESPSNADHDALAQWVGLPVRRIAFEGVTVERLAPLSDHLAQAIGAPLTQEDLAKSLRQLYATGLYESIEVEGMRDGDGVDLVFKGTPRMFIGTITVNRSEERRVGKECRSRWSPYH